MPLPEGFHPPFFPESWLKSYFSVAGKCGRPASSKQFVSGDSPPLKNSSSRKGKDRSVGWARVSALLIPTLAESLCEGDAAEFGKVLYSTKIADWVQRFVQEVFR